ncbi:MAG: PAS domain S-box protein [Rhodospirillaceae bacterium]|nr:PAS domain S-box protein [Rhodospirillales bacterium]
MEGFKPRSKPGFARRATRGRVIRGLLSRIDELEAAQVAARRAQDALLATTEALRASEERYALAMRGPNEGLWDWDANTKELYLSARLLSILGFASENLHTTSHDWLELVHPHDRELYETTLVDHLKGKTDHFECEYRVRDHTGDYRWVLARGLAVRDETGRGTRMVGSVGDITERKLREASLKASESRFRSLVATAASVILMIGRDGIIQEFNREAEIVFDMARIYAIDRHWTKVLGDLETAFSPLVDAALRGEEVRDHEIFVQRPGRAPRVLSWNLARSEDCGASVVAVGTDVTRRRIAERGLSEANELLEQRVTERTREAQAAQHQAELASRAKTEFVANMSHELRTPLNAIIGFSDVMRLEVMGPIQNPRYTEYIRDIHDSGSHLLEVINDILDLAKVEAGKFVLNREPSDMRAIVNGAMRLMAERAQKAGVVLECRMGAGLGMGLVDPLRIKQVLLNLLSNAVKFTPEGGSIFLVADCGPAGITLSVTDTGIGMDQSHVARAMQPFAQIDSSLARRYPGTGLGLPLAKSFVELHGGTIMVESVMGRGTTVTVVLPPEL